MTQHDFEFSFVQDEIEYIDIITEETTSKDECEVYINNLLEGNHIPNGERTEIRVIVTETKTQTIYKMNITNVTDLGEDWYDDESEETEKTVIFDKTTNTWIP